MAYLKEIPVDSIVPSPYQKRQRFSTNSLRRLADDIALNGLLHPILCRPVNEHYELVVGERRLRATKLIPQPTILAQVREMTDLEARRICAAENAQREDLSPVESIEAIADWVDAYLMDVDGYAQFGDSYMDRLGNLLSRLDSDRRNGTNYLTHKFMGKVEEAFTATNRGITWRSFFENDLRPYVKLSPEVKEIAVEKALPKSTAFALQTLKEDAPKVFEEARETGQVDLGTFTEDKYDLTEVSAREIEQKARQEKLLREVRERSENVLQLEMPQTPQGYRAIVIDPPWPMQKIIREVRPNQDVLDYPTMTLEEIARLPVSELACQEGCHIYLWVTHRLLPEGLRLFEEWNVNYQCLMTWVKPTGMTPYTWMYDTEHVLFGRIGSLTLERNGLRLSFTAPVTQHSAKPDVFYERVLQASPGPRLEMFARKQRAGFTVWGDEVDE